MSKVHVELAGFAGFDTVEEARAFAYAVEELLNLRADANNTVAKIYDFENKIYHSIVESVIDMSKVFVGLQGATARLNQLGQYAKKTTTIVDGVDWSKHILKCVDNRYSIDEELYIETCANFLNEGLSIEEFIANIPEGKIIPVN